MDDPVRDPRFEKHATTPGRVPVGFYPIPNRRGFHAVECVHCARPLGVTRWDYWNGFLVVCPHCRGYHGKPWSIEKPLVAGLFLNALSFFLTMRPRQAIVAIAGFVVACWALVVLAGENQTHDGFTIAAGITIVLGPVVINAIQLVRHQSRLDTSPPGDQRSREY